MCDRAKRSYIAAHSMAARKFSSIRPLRPSASKASRGARRPAIEPRKFPILGADTVHMVEGNILGRVSASARTTRRGQRPWNCGVSVEGCRQIGPALWLLQKVECAHLSFVAGRLSGAPIVQRGLRPSLEKRLHAFPLPRLGLAR